MFGAYYFAAIRLYLDVSSMPILPCITMSTQCLHSKSTIVTWKNIYLFGTNFPLCPAKFRLGRYVNRICTDFVICLGGLRPLWKGEHTRAFPHDDGVFFVKWDLQWKERKESGISSLTGGYFTCIIVFGWRNYIRKNIH